MFGGSWPFVLGDTIGLEPPELTTIPAPANHAIGVLPDADLSWAGGRRATTFVVHFGLTSPPPEYMTVSATVTTCVVPPLAPTTRYYWRVDAVNSEGTTVGTEWYFTTGTPIGSGGVFLLGCVPMWE